MAKNVRTAWGVLTKDEDGVFLGDSPVIELGGSDELESSAYMVLVVIGGYAARWIDENGEKHEKVYKSRAAALNRARESWGR